MSMDNEKKREIIAAYKQKKTTGGVYKITNRESGKCMIKGEIDLPSFQNRFAFSMKIGSCLNPRLQADFDRFGPQSFQFEILEEVTKKEEVTTAGFRDQLKKLEEHWNERYGEEIKY